MYVNQRASQLVDQVSKLANGNACSIKPETPPEKLEKPVIAASVDVCTFDLFIVMDTSGSIEEEYFQQRDFIADMLGSLNAGYYTSGKVGN